MYSFVLSTVNQLGRMMLQDVDDTETKLLHCHLFYVIFHFTHDLLYASDCNFFVTRYVGSLMITTQVVCGGTLSRSVSVTT